MNKDAMKDDNILIDSGDSSMVYNYEQILSCLNKKYKMLFHEAGDAIFLVKDGEYVDCNQKAEEILRCTKEKIIGEFPKRFAPDYQYNGEKSEGLIAGFYSKMEKREIIRTEWTALTYDKNKIETELTISAFSLNGEYYQQIILRDISKRKKLERESILFDNILRNIHEGVMVTDNNYKVIFVNEAFQKITGFKDEELKNMCMRYLDVEGNSIRDEIVEHININGMWSGILYSINKNGQLFPKKSTIRKISSENDTYIYETFMDISKEREVINSMNKVFNNDILTRMYNHIYFRKKIEEEIKKIDNTNKYLVLCFFNIDNFKKINDLYGYSFGDKVLANISQKIKISFQDKGIVARVNGDEFGVLFNKFKDIQSSVQIIRNTINSFKKCFLLDDTEIQINFSAGISIYNKDSRSADELLKNASSALKYAKKTGKNKSLFYSQKLNSMIVKKLKLEHYLKKAIEKDQFTMNYQPQINLENNTIEGFEALIRWHHPVLGNIPPSDFIPLAEETGLIVDIGELVLKKVCNQIIDWISKGLNPLKIAVNISPIQFKSVDMVNLMDEILCCKGLSGKYLELEITENVLIEELDEVVAKLNELKKRGITISIDDFGVGYSSLKYIRDIPVDKLKIDRTFIKDIPHKDNGSIAKTVIQLGNILDFKVIAEGVETEEQVRFLKENGCTNIQGYYYSPPVRAEKAEDILRGIAENKELHM